MIHFNKLKKAILFLFTLSISSTLVAHTGFNNPLLPVEKGISILKWIDDKNSQRIIDERITVSSQLEEMKLLSQKLGFRIRNPKHMPLYREAASWLGTRYRWAGMTRKGVDCSGLTNMLFQTVYQKELDRSSYVIARNLNQELQKDELEPGDLLFFTTMRRKSINHVGVYLGDGHFIHASRKGVVVSSLEDSYYARTLKKAGRL